MIATHRGCYYGILGDRSNLGLWGRFVEDYFYAGYCLSIQTKIGKKRTIIPIRIPGSDK